MTRLGRKLVMTGLIGIVLVACGYCLNYWNRSNFCGGWAEHHRDRSNELDTQMLVELINKRVETAKELAIAARHERLIADKYSRVARNPFLPYPKAPLINQEEREKIEKESEWLITGQIPYQVPRS